MSGTSDSLDFFHPLIGEWFLARYGRPTAVQAAAWPAIQSGAHVLALAPTGSGKTLTAFLGAISRIASGEIPVDVLSVLYVSPLKALGEDIRRNLEGPLAELGELFRSRGESWPDIRVATRSGDTSQTDRRRMLKRPPAILVTTPESLALMLDSSASRAMLADTRLLVLDEIHVLAGDKRGAMLACSVGRLALLAGEFQRVALSATARPVEALADFVGGRRLERGPDGRTRYERRQVTVVAPAAEKRIELSVEWPEIPPAAEAEGPRATAAESAPRYAAVIPAIVSEMGSGHGVLVFTDSRRRAERMAFLVAQSAGEGSAWAHHGSLSKEARRLVEERFKAGELGCVVATASLELGIDVGSVDKVALAGTPATVASSLQRIGRSGHRVGEPSRATLYPFHGMDLVLAAAAARGVAERAVEETRPLASPLDVLAQVLLELIAEDGPRPIDALFDTVLSFPPFERLTRSLFDSTLAMLAGRYSGSRLRELEPKISIDAASGTAVAGKGTRGLLYSSGGTIPDRGLFSMRIAGSKTRIGELDEEFVWERKVGEVFTLGAQTWRITEIGSEAVTVVPAGPDPDIVPFWKGGSRYRSRELSSRALDLLDTLGELDEEASAAVLKGDYCFSPSAAKACARFVAAQKVAGLGRRSLPGSRCVVLEDHEEGGERDSARLVLHTLRGLAINEPLSLTLAGALEEASGLPVRTIADDDLILLSVARSQSFDPTGYLARILRSLVDGDRLERLVRSKLESSGVFGAQFRENAGRALLLPRGLPGKRKPLWMTRLRAKKLFEAVRGYPDFPIVVETWRSCLSDIFDMEGTKELIADLASGRIELSIFSSRSPSPFAREALWKEIGDNMYRGDEIEGRVSSSVSDQAIAEALRSAGLRPRLDPELLRDFEARLKRLVPGWAPDDPPALAEWARERVLIPVSELPLILENAGSGLAPALDADPTCGGRLVRLRLPGASEEALVHAERVPELEAAPASLIVEWLRREAVVHPSRISSLFGVSGPELADTLRDLVEDGTIVADVSVGDARGGLEGAADTEGPAYIDAQNLEIVLRRTRAASRPIIVARPPEDLARFVFSVQSLAEPVPADPAQAIARALASLSGAALPAPLWETDILPARVARYRRADLDLLLATTPWQWFGAGKELVSFADMADLELFLPRRSGLRSESRMLPGGGQTLDFWAIREKSGLSSAQAAIALWAEAWRGLVASDSFRDVREGIDNGFGKEVAEILTTPAEADTQVATTHVFGAPRRLPRALRERWRRGAPVGGRWFRLDFDEDDEETEEDGLAALGLDAARVRALAGRYGLLCRGMLEREPPGLRWGDLFPAMRRLELAGELLAGRFFEGLEGPQFLDPAAMDAFTGLDRVAGRPRWINALDPAANALYALSVRPEGLPPRVAANRLCIDAGRLVATSLRSYRILSIYLPPDDSRLQSVLGLFPAARNRDARPERRIVVETVNGASASTSPYAAVLRAAGFEADRGRMVLW
jgi:ATP-dependent Lhr-like helicase